MAVLPPRGLSPEEVERPRNGSGAAATRSTRSISAGLSRDRRCCRLILVVWAPPATSGRIRRRMAAKRGSELLYPAGQRNGRCRAVSGPQDPADPDDRQGPVRRSARRRRRRSTTSAETKIRMSFSGRSVAKLVNAGRMRASFTAACGSRCRSTATTCRRTSHCFSSKSESRRSSFPAPGSRSCSSGTTTRRRSFRSGFSTTGRSMRQVIDCLAFLEGFLPAGSKNTRVRPQASH